MVVPKTKLKGRWREVAVVLTGIISVTLQVCSYFGYYDAESAVLTQKEKNILMGRSQDLVEEKQHFLERTFQEYMKVSDPILAQEMKSVYTCYQGKEYLTCMDKLAVLIEKYPDKEASLSYIKVSIRMYQKLNAYIQHKDYGAMNHFFEEMDKQNP